MMDATLFDQSPRTLDTGGGANLTNDGTGGLPFRHNAPSTSRRAAEAAADRAPTARARVLAFIRERGSLGTTADEAAAALGMPIQTASPRMLELRRDGLIVDAGRERRTRWGQAARVYVAREHGRGAA